MRQLDSTADDHGWNEQQGQYITTYTGKIFLYDDPKPEMIDIEDIAHALSQLCRFAGHTSRFMSVAEHSIYVSWNSENELEGLLHDADEAYMVDIPSTLKTMLPDYKKIEKTVQAVIMKHFGLNYPLSKDTKEADTAQLISEAETLIKNNGWTKMWHPTKKGIVPHCYPPEIAKTLFLQRFYTLTHVDPQLKLYINE